MRNKTNNNQVATKAELKRTEKALRSEIKNGNKLLRREILKVEERVEDLEEGQKRIETRLDGLDKGQVNLSEKFDKLYNLVLEFLGRTNNLEKENEVGAEQYRDHEKRISKLETAAQPA